ncbi:hypothetical protein [uncultured Bartonella sp.]|uniref:hypothetical protein n=1 Tax=uncultured Bartonella sp. TaxID=104108 RepID=UPI0025D9E62E|nr:hypothetical protein [uncultured Bartonella sp.]
MAKEKSIQNASVTLTDGFDAGMHDAMARIKELNLKSTLVSEISDEMWATWDASNEDALVVDTSANEDSNEEDLLAA